MQSVKYVVILCCSLFFSFAYANITTSIPGLLHCPKLSDIQVEIEKGKASANANWHGRSAIPLRHTLNWRELTAITNVSAGGHCEYYMGLGSIEIIELSKKDFPPDYNLYDESLGLIPVSNCMEDPQNAHQVCYFFRNSV